MNIIALLVALFGLNWQANCQLGEIKLWEDGSYQITGNFLEHDDIDYNGNSAVCNLRGDDQHISYTTIYAITTTLYQQIDVSYNWYEPFPEGISKVTRFIMLPSVNNVQTFNTESFHIQILQ